MAPRRSTKTGGARTAKDQASFNGSRGEFVYRSLVDAIRSGKLLPGHRVREEEIASELGVSRTPVREAIQLLQARRLIELVPGSGLAIAELNIQQVIELYGMREVLEGAAARFAAQHANPAEVIIMHRLVDEFDAARGDVPKLAQLNVALHDAIYEAAHNRYMQEALETLGDSLSLLRNTTFSLPDRHAAAVKEHRDIVNAIEARDASTAEAAARLHIREAQRVRLTMLLSQ